MSQFQASTLACLATLGTLLFSVECAAQMPGVVDVALHNGGLLRGTVVNEQGMPRVGCDVLIRQNGQMVAAAKTDEKGEFQVSNLRGGVYLAASGSSACVFRAWAWRTAPPVAGTDLKVTVATTDELPIVRGQITTPLERAYDWIEAHPVLGYGLIVAAIAVPIAVIGDNVRSDAS